MRLRRKRPAARTWSSSDEEARPPVTYIGFAEPTPYLYEFRTADGHHVYLHDFTCVGIGCDPVAQQLELTFEGVPDDVLGDETVVLTFEQAEICEWRDDRRHEDVHLVHDDPDIRGQVSDLALFDNGVFYLSLLDVDVFFRAASVRCHAVVGPPRRDERL